MADTEEDNDKLRKGLHAVLSLEVERWKEDYFALYDEKSRWEGALLDYKVAVARGEMRLQVTTIFLSCFACLSYLHHFSHLTCLSVLPSLSCFLNLWYRSSLSLILPDLSVLQMAEDKAAKYLAHIKAMKDGHALVMSIALQEEGDGEDSGGLDATVTAPGPPSCV
jgi:hypothetical protein